MKSRRWQHSLEHLLEEALYWARWILAPAYLVLALCLAVLTFKVFEEFWQLIAGLRAFNETQAILQVLTVVDLVLVLNLVLMITFVGYENFVSKIHPTDAEDWPGWTRKLDYAGLKVQLMGSIIAITSIKMLREFVALIDVGNVNHDKLTWMVVLYVGFLFAALCVAVVNRLKVKSEPDDHGDRELQLISE